MPRSLLIMAFTLLPYAWLVVSSFKPSAEIFTQTPSWRIQMFNWRHYQWALGPTGADLGVYFRNTVLAAGSTALLTAVLASMGGYAMAQSSIPAAR